MSLQVTGQAQGLVLPISQKSGQANSVSMGWNNEFLVSELQGRYGYLALSGSLFHGSLTAAAALNVPGTAAGPYTLFNPAGSGVNLVVLNCNVGLAAVPTAAANEVDIVLTTLTGATLSATTTGGSVINALVGGSLKNAVGQLLTAATVSAATKPIRSIGYVGDVATTSVMINGQIEVDLAGAIILAPGAFLSIQGIGTTPANFSVIASMTWAEMPV